MPQDSDFWAPRASFLPPIAELDIVADLLSDAADCLLAGQIEQAREKVLAADMPVVFDYANRIMGREDAQIHRRRPVATLVANVNKVAARMPSESDTQTMYARDGWRCRFCGCRIVVKQARDRFRASLPGVIQWGETRGLNHGAFYALAAVADHVVPYTHGGGNDPGNIVTTCWPCNVGRNSWSLEEVGLLDPRLRPPVVDGWDGLMRLSTLPTPGKMKVGTPLQQNAGREQGMDDMVLAKQLASDSRAIEAQGWTEAINRFGPETSKRLTQFAARCAEFGIFSAVKKSMLFKMRAGEVTIELIGVEANGDVTIPWRLYGKKDALKDFAHTIAPAFPDAIVRRARTQWVVRREERKFNVLEFLDAADAIYDALPALRAKLDGP